MTKWVSMNEWVNDECISVLMNEWVNEWVSDLMCEWVSE